MRIVALYDQQLVRGEGEEELGRMLRQKFCETQEAVLQVLRISYHSLSDWEALLAPRLHTSHVTRSKSERAVMGYSEARRRTDGGRQCTSYLASSLHPALSLCGVYREATPTKPPLNSMTGDRQLAAVREQPGAEAPPSDARATHRPGATLCSMTSPALLSSRHSCMP